MLKPNRRRWLMVTLVGLLGLAYSTVDWRLLSRPITYPDNPITNADWYQPQQRVVGGPRGSAPIPASDTTVIPPEALGTAVEFAEAQNSVALLVMHRDRLVLEQYWHDHAADSPINGMSMTKTLVALLMGIAIDEGHITSLQDPIATYIDEWADDDRGQITLADLLYMQSGLRNDDRTTTLQSDLVQLYGGSDVHRTALAIPAEDPPGQQFAYNNVNSQLAAIALERATGESFGDYLSSRLWQPLGSDDGFLWLDRPGGNAKPFCCFFATVRDWLRVGQMILHQGRVNDTQVVPAAWIQQMQGASPLEPTFGLHLWIKARTPAYPQVNQAASAPFAAPDTVYLDGRYHQRVYVIPSYDLVIVRIGEYPPAWDDAVIPNALVDGLQQASE
ncbi:serine hydrolase [Nodosilinea sp. P-1105]|uniref:serine hydrolase domain-containing protein n=1 Tax=Nodosilinea sp. P-1105 TaxID=2546229 RepID=UPI001F0F91CB|nr:serine hydrolase [Nodosilinea sp. P-1105]